MPGFVLVVAFLALDRPDNPVLAAAKKRQEALRSVEFVMKGTEVTEAGGEGRTAPPPGQPPKSFPKQRTTAERTARVVFDGERSRVEHTRRVEGAEVGLRDLWVCDGSVVKHLMGPPGRETWQNAGGSISTPQPTHAGADWHLWPVLVAARPFGTSSWHPVVDFPRLQPTGQSLALDGATTEEWVPGEPARGQVLRYWIDPTAGHAVRRSRREGNNVSAIQHDITYTKHAASGQWLPASWKYAEEFTDGTPRRTVTWTVEKVAINEPQPDDVFDLTFPPGVRVDDERTKREYMVLEDGTLGDFVHGPNGQPIPPATPASPPNWFAANGPWLFGVVLVVVVVGLLVVRRVRRKV